MILQQIIGNTDTLPLDGKEIDPVEIEWFEATRRIQRKRTAAGTDIAIRFLREGQCLRHNDILYLDEHKAIVVQVKPCEAIVVAPATLLEMGTLCYEIGNKHLPMFIQNDEILLPYEDPLFRWLQAGGYNPVKEVRQLLNILKSTVSPHSHNSSTLFTKILGMAARQS